MSSSIRRKNSSISNKLLDNPFSYDFFQSVRLLEREAKVFDKNSNKRRTTGVSGNPVATFVPPNTEAIRFHTNQTLRFSSAEIAKISQQVNQSTPQAAAQWHMLVNFMGLTGTQGVLPYHYTEMILHRLKMKDESLMKFFDLFNHRTISLFFQAGCKYRLPIEYERKKLNPPSMLKYDTYTKMFLSLIGIGTKHLNDRLYTKDESLIFYSGLLSQQIRSATGLKQIIQQHFSIPVQIQEFIGQWQELIDDVRSKLPSRKLPLGQNIALGKSAILGRRGWFAQGKIRIILGPLNDKQTQKFAPDTKTLYAINEIVKMYIGMEHDYDFIVRIKRRDMLDKTQLSSKKPPIIGWNTWLVNKPKQDYDETETLDISVSNKQF
ncbi:type VI secretion system baseplate subunit TssG [Aliikangiella sp. IMCC44359]|uniref:type VI secretion system baseplate subunit TssG n=1 Tax=Aliikangiella sp. IMCC44359 TaxID=3459125 RepID=UPI00403AD9EA